VNLQTKLRLLDLGLVLLFSMKKLLFSFLFVFLFNSNSFSQIVYIDMNYILNNSKIGKSLNSHLIKINNEFLSKFNQIENDLKKKERELLAQKNIIEKNEFDEKIANLSKDIQNFRFDKKNSQEKLKKIKLENTNKILNIINPIITDYVDSNSISLVVSKKNIIVGKKNLDITMKIIKLLNDQVEILNF